MKFRSLIFLLSFLSVCFAEEYPSSNDPQEFAEQAEEFLIQSLKEGRPVINPDGAKQPTPLKDDKRDWESVFARIHGDPQKYGFDTSQVVMNIAFYRGTAKDPKMIAATARYWDARVHQADELYEHFAAEGTPKHTGITSLLGSTIPWTLRFGAPEHLSMILDYFNSSADDRNELIFQKGPPIHISEALRNYGNENHIEAAKKFAQKLRDIGKDEIANDIDRSVERIQKDGKRAQATAQRDLPSTKTDQPGQVDDSTAAEGKRGPSLPWIIGGIAAVVAIAGVIAVSRRAK